MNLNELLIKLLGETGLEVVQDFYDGEADRYILFSYEDERPENWGDNQAGADTAYIQIQLITPKEFDYFTLKKKIRDLLEGADFIVTSTRSFLGSGVYVGTEKIRQTIFHVEYTEGRK